MKKFFCSLLCLLLLTSCGKVKVMPHAENPVEALSDVPEDVWMEVPEDSVTPSSVTFVVHNQSGYCVDYDSFFYSLEVEDGGDWYSVLPKGDGAMVSMLIPVRVESGSASKLCSVDLSDQYEELLPGHYRLVKDTIMYGDVTELGPRNLYGHVKTVFKWGGEFDIEN